MAWSLLLLGNLAAIAGPAYVRRETNGRFVIGNDYLQRTIELKENHVCTTEFLNKVSGRFHEVKGNQFELVFIWERLQYESGNENPWRLTSRDFTVDSHETASTAHGAKQLVFTLSNHERKPGLEIRLIYEIAPDEQYTRQWMQIRTTGDGQLFLDYAAIEANTWPGSELTLGGFGQPLFGRDLFWGLEHPSGINQVSDGETISLGLYVGLSISSDRWTTAKAVVGVSLPGDARTAFFSYINQIRARPVRPYVLYNTWYDLQRPEMNQTTTINRVHQLDATLQKKYGLKLDSFVLDDGWDEWQHLWKIDTSRFPDGFHDLSSALQGIGSGLGIWYGPIGGYSHRKLRIETGRRQGMEIESNGQYLCLAGRRYSQYFTDSLLDMEKTYNINYFKLDGVPFGCNEPDHGHPTGIYSREADERVFIDLLSKLRQQRPDVFLNITTGLWLSPWWLQYADTVWMGGEDSGYLESLPTMSARQSAISYRDAVLYDDFVRQKWQFPLSSIMTHGIIRGRYNLLGGTRESLADWTDELVHYASVGNMMVELYITPDLLDAAEWDALAATLRWAKANQHPLLDDGRMVLGNPARREPYGFVHTSAEKTIITLRNPFARPQWARLRLDQNLGFAAADRTYQLQTIYPFSRDEAGLFTYGDAINVELGAFEERVLELRPARESAARLRVIGARYSVETKGEHQAAIHLYAPAGASLPVQITEVGGVKHDSMVRFGNTSQKETTLSISAPEVLEGPRQQVKVAVSLQIPGDTAGTTVAFLYEPANTTKGAQAMATDNGKAVAVRVENGGQDHWQWFSATLQPGTHSLQFEFALPDASVKAGKLSGWVMARRHLAEVSVPVQLNPHTVFTPSSERLPVSNDIEAETFPLLERVVP